MARKRRSKEETRKVDALIERLREFVRFNYVTAGEVAREIGVHDSSVYSWLLGQARPRNPSGSRLSWILYRDRRDPASLRSATSIANTRTGAGFPSRAVARSASRARARFGEREEGF